jgi:prepilin-type N-terminal cleavage/methylation domain-containing protein
VNSRSRSAAFTLAEMAAAVAILSVIALVAGYALAAAGRVQARVAPAMEAAGEAEAALEHLRRELRALPGAGAITRLAPTEFAFVDALGRPVAYRWIGQDLARNGDRLAGNVSALRFEYWTNAGVPASSPATLALIEVVCTIAVGSEAATARAVVFPRGLAP